MHCCIVQIRVMSRSNIWFMDESFHDTHTHSNDRNERNRRKPELPWICCCSVSVAVSPFSSVPTCKNKELTPKWADHLSVRIATATPRHGDDCLLCCLPGWIVLVRWCSCGLAFTYLVRRRGRFSNKLFFLFEQSSSTSFFRSLHVKILLVKPSS